MEKLLGEIKMQCLDALLHSSEPLSSVYYASMWMHLIHVKIKQIPDIAGTAETVTKVAASVTFLLQQSLMANETSVSLLSLTHYFLKFTSQSVCVKLLAQSW